MPMVDTWKRGPLALGELEARLFLVRLLWQALLANFLNPRRRVLVGTALACSTRCQKSKKITGRDPSKLR